MDSHSNPAGAGPLDGPVRAPRPKLDEVAKRIAAHLKRLEADAAWNVTREGRRRLWCSGSGRAGSRVSVVYISYQGATNLTRDEAERYLAALDAGFKGRHFEAFREQQRPNG